MQNCILLLNVGHCGLPLCVAIVGCQHTDYSIFLHLAVCALAVKCIKNYNVKASPNSQVTGTEGGTGASMGVVCSAGSKRCFSPSLDFLLKDHSKYQAGSPSVGISGR